MSLSDSLTPSAFRAIATIVRAVRDGSASAQAHAETVAASESTEIERSHARGYALGWSACATLASLTAADAGAHDVLGDLALTTARMTSWPDRAMARERWGHASDALGGDRDT